MFSSSSSSNNSDPVIGVDVSGTLFYFHRSKLLQCGSSYFSNRLGGQWDAEVAYKDERGRRVIFLGRSPSRFQHIRDFILTQTLHLPSDNDTSIPLRRALREEALYLGMDPLLEALKVCHSFSPSDYNQGVLYWLGTKRGTAPYQNPYSIGAVHVGGWVDDIHALDAADARNPSAGCAASREALVHYRQKFSINIGNKKTPHNCFWRINSVSRLLWCDHAIKRYPVVVDLKDNIQVRPTHYSLRSSACYGMHGDWNFEGSVDGVVWDTLHAARNDTHLYVESEDDIREKVNNAIVSHNQETRTDDMCSEILLGVLEQDHRHTWELDPAPSQFYRYFRIIGAGSMDDILDEQERHDLMNDEEDHGHNPPTCLHGEGLELFGDVCVE